MNAHDAKPHFNNTAFRKLVSMRDILHHYDLLKKGRLKRGRRKLSHILTGQCPFHEHTADETLVVDLETNTWECTGLCKSGGTQISFIMCKERGSTQDEAALKAIELFGLKHEDVFGTPRLITGS